MGNRIVNPPKPVVRVKVAPTNFRGILNLAQTVHDDTLANVADYATPIPTSANFQTAITDLRTSLNSLGTKFNRGGSAALNNVKAKAFVVFAMLTERQAYVQSVVDGSSVPADQAVLISKSGFASKSKRSRIPALQFVRKAKQSSSKQYPVVLRRMDWRKSLGLFKGTVIKSYNIYGYTALLPTVKVFLTSTTKTNYIVPALAFFNGQLASIDFIEIHPVNARGEGNGFKIPVK